MEDVAHLACGDRGKNVSTAYRSQDFRLLSQSFGIGFEGWVTISRRPSSSLVSVSDLGLEVSAHAADQFRYCKSEKRVCVCVCV